MTTRVASHATPDRRRKLRRFTLPRDLVEQLDAEAAAQGIATDRLVERIVSDFMPGVLADAARAYVAESITQANSLERDRERERALPERPPK